jgi:hypothetical protein
MVKQLFSWIVLGLLLGLFLIPVTYFESNPIPGRDSGVFLYIGDQILNGKVPYRDIWDHKPPLIFFLNSLGLLIGGGSSFGVYLLEFLSVLVAAIISFELLKKLFGYAASLTGTIAWIVSLSIVVESGNFTEEYALPLQFGALWLCYESEKKGYYGYRAVLIGLAAALAFLLKQNLIGVWIAIGLYVVVSRVVSYRWSELLKVLGLMLAGAVSVFLLTIIYFAANNALDSLIDQAIKYNFAYSNGSSNDKLQAVLLGLIIFTFSRLTYLVLLGWFVGLLYLRYNKNFKTDQKTLLIIALIGVPIEFILASLSGRLYYHYYIAWLPVFAIMTSFVVYLFTSIVTPALSKAISKGKERLAQQRTRLFNLAEVTILLFIIILLPLSYILSQIFSSGNNDGEQTAVAAVNYIKQSTGSSDYVLMWGAETSINFVSQRQSPTRYTYQYALYTPGYQSAELTHAFLSDLENNKPALIIDSSNETGNGSVPPIDQASRETWMASNSTSIHLPADIDKVFDYISAHYQMVGTVGTDKWPVYAYKK